MKKMNRLLGLYSAYAYTYLRSASRHRCPSLIGVRVLFLPVPVLAVSLAIAVGRGMDGG